MSNVPHRRTTPKEDKQTGVGMVIMFGAGAAICIACLMTEGFGMWPVYIPLLACVIGIVGGAGTIKEANKKLKKSTEREA